MRRYRQIVAFAVTLVCVSGGLAETRLERTEREKKAAVTIEACVRAIVAEGGGREFDGAWSGPFAVPGDDGFELEFRNGTIAVLDGKVSYSEGLEVKIARRGGTTSYAYDFIEGRWVSTGFAVVVGGDLGSGQLERP